MNPTNNQNKEKKIYGVYTRSLLSMKVCLDITEVGKNVKRNLENKIAQMTEGRCIEQGFIRPNSVKIISYSSGVVGNDHIEFETNFECMVCFPMQGMLVECYTKSITIAGIRAEVREDIGTDTGNSIVPLDIFVPRDYYIKDRTFQEIKENTKIVVEVIGVRFELNDPTICVVAKIMDVSYQS